jgi:hypothetical protein
MEYLVDIRVAEAKTGTIKGYIYRVEEGLVTAFRLDRAATMLRSLRSFIRHGAICEPSYHPGARRRGQ